MSRFRNRPDPAAERPERMVRAVGMVRGERMVRVACKPPEPSRLTARSTPDGTAGYGRTPPGWPGPERQRPSPATVPPSRWGPAEPWPVSPATVECRPTGLAECRLTARVRCRPPVLSACPGTVPAALVVLAVFLRVALVGWLLAVPTVVLPVAELRYRAEARCGVARRCPDVGRMERIRPPWVRSPPAGDDPDGARGALTTAPQV
nr:hypothetical protein Ade03nite_06100 [Actinoplanes derwentensis]